MPARVVVAAVFISLVANTSAQSQPKFDDLLRRIPPTANAIVVMDVAGIHESALAKKEGWMNKHEAAFVDRPLMLPPEADRLVLASRIGRNVRTSYELAVMSLKEPLSMRSIARAERGYLDKIDGVEAVWTPSEAYFVALDPKTVGVMYPGDRQLVSRWATSKRLGGVSQYLQAAASTVGRGSQIALALDLNNAVEPHRLDELIETSPTLQKSKVDVNKLSPLLLGLKGITLQISITDAARGEFRIDFSQPITLKESLIKSLLLEGLANFGASIDDLEDWNASVSGDSVLLTGPLSKSGLRRILSVLEIPTTKFSSVADESLDELTSDAEIASASRAYFKSVTVLLDDLHTDRDKRDTRGGKDAVWMDRYAKKIDRLPILNVDEELLVFGTNCAETLRVMATARRGAGLSAGTRVANAATGGYSGAYGAYSYGYGGTRVAADLTAGNRAASRDRAAIRSQEQNRATGTRTEGWRLIDNATGDIRKKMTAKYKIEF